MHMNKDERQGDEDCAKTPNRQSVPPFLTPLCTNSNVILPRRLLRFDKLSH